MSSKITYTFSGKLWRHSPNGGWYFVSLPKDISKEIRTQNQWMEEGWGRLKATAEILNLQWNTSIWFDTKIETYLLPIKADIRRKTKIKIDEVLDVKIFI
ncbi:DUF1905 domain-containing protein [Tenacibaculum sp. 190524A05c]|uniref:DUF1905 domain-containing protein n=1 Tax=Tenacibaculum platacis TaxID=3137852 RepID=UPI0031FAB614